MSDEKFIARPTFNRLSKKWNIAVKLKNEKKEIKIGSMIEDGPFFKYLEFDKKKDVIEYINKEERLMLKNDMEESLKKYGRNK